MTVAVLPGDDAEAQVWATALEVARLFADLPWVLIGAQMVMVLEREAGRPSGRPTGSSAAPRRWTCSPLTISAITPT